MNILQTNSQKNPRRFPLFNLGFRPFFLCAGLYAVLSISLWSLIYFAQIQLPLSSISNYQWHAHEMIYGYSIAVITGFLLTAVKNWTGMQTIYGVPLFLLTSLWIIARVLFSSGELFLAGCFDLLFMLGLSVAIVFPIVKTKKWKQLAVVSMLLFLFIGNLLFYLGAFGIVEDGVHLGIYGGLYLVVGLILKMGRRVVPFFIECGVDYPVKLYNSKLLDVLSFILFLIFAVCELTQSYPIFSAYSALLLFFINGVRLVGWHTHGIWKKPLLWSLYVSMWFICFAFLLFFASYLVDISKYIAIHSFSYAGIGLITLGMMSRVALGHTGRNTREPPYSIGIALALLVLGAVIRVIFPLISPNYYVFWIGMSQILWIISFVIFLYLYFPMLTKDRVDGQFG